MIPEYIGIQKTAFVGENQYLPAALNPLSYGKFATSKEKSPIDGTKSLTVYGTPCSPAFKPTPSGSVPAKPLYLVFSDPFIIATRPAILLGKFG